MPPWSRATLRLCLLLRCRRESQREAVPSPLLLLFKNNNSTTGPAKIGELSKTTATGVAVRKGESDPPLLPDDQYPAWLWELATPEPSTAELQRLYEQDGLTLPQMKRLFRYKNKQRIREENAARAKK